MIIGMIMVVYTITALNLSLIFNKMKKRLNVNDPIPIYFMIWVWPLGIFFVSLLMAYAFSRTSDEEIDNFFE